MPKSITYKDLKNMNLGVDASTVLYSTIETVSSADTIEALIYPNLETIGASAFKGKYSNNKSLKYVYMPKVVNALGAAAENSNNGCLYQAFSGCSNILDINFNGLVNLTGSDALQEAFKGCTSLTYISFPSLNTITNVNPMYQCFYGCTSLIEADFPELEIITGGRTMGELFRGCTSLTTVNFPKLRRIENTSTSFSTIDQLGIAFYGCSSLRSISFPSLEYVYSNGFGDSSSGTSVGQGMFSNTPNLEEVHFPAAIQSLIESTSGYSTAWGHGSNSIVMFDL